MRNFLAMWRRELMTYLLSPSAWIIAMFVLVVTGGGFALQAMLSRGAPLRVDILLFRLPTLWLMVLIVVTAITMRLFAEEKKSGTIETLMTAPVTESQIVLGKYFAALTLFLAVFAPTAGHIWILREFSEGLHGIDAGMVVTGYLLLALIGAFYISVGLLVSAMARNQMVAAVTCFAFLCLLFILGGTVGHVLSGRGVALAEFASPFEHIVLFSMGILDSRVIVFYVSATVAVLFAAVRIVESRRWF